VGEKTVLGHFINLAYRQLLQLLKKTLFAKLYVVQPNSNPFC